MEGVIIMEGNARVPKRSKESIARRWLIGNMVTIAKRLSRNAEYFGID